MSPITSGFAKAGVHPEIPAIASTLPPVLSGMPTGTPTAYSLLPAVSPTTDVAPLSTPSTPVHAILAPKNTAPHTQDKTIAPEEPRAVAYSAALPILQFFFSPEHLQNIALASAEYGLALGAFLFLTEWAKHSLRKKQDQALVVDATAREPLSPVHTAVTAAQWLGAIGFASQALEGNTLASPLPLFILTALTALASYATAKLGPHVDATANALNHRLKKESETQTSPAPDIEEFLTPVLSEDRHWIARIFLFLRNNFAERSDKYLLEQRKREVTGEKLTQFFKNEPERAALFADKILVRLSKRHVSDDYRIRLLVTLATIANIIGRQSDLSEMVRKTLPFAKSKNEYLRRAVAHLYASIIACAPKDQQSDLLEHILLAELSRSEKTENVLRAVTHKAQTDRLIDTLLNVLPFLDAQQVETVIVKIFINRPQWRQDNAFLKKVSEKILVNAPQFFAVEKIARLGQDTIDFGTSAIATKRTEQTLITELDAAYAKLPDGASLDDVLPQLRSLLRQIHEPLRMMAAVHLTVLFAQRPGEVTDFQDILTDLTDAAKGTPVQRRINPAIGRLGNGPGGKKWLTESLASTGYLTAEFTDPVLITSSLFELYLSQKEQNDYLGNTLGKIVSLNDTELYKTWGAVFESEKMRHILRKCRILDPTFAERMRNIVSSRDHSGGQAQIFCDQVKAALEPELRATLASIKEPARDPDEMTRLRQQQALATNRMG